MRFIGDFLLFCAFALIGTGAVLLVGAAILALSAGLSAGLSAEGLPNNAAALYCETPSDVIDNLSQE